jgi:5-(carboxyamino)imidazole ribonucleotide mutase
LPTVAVVLGSDSDRHIFEDVKTALDELKIPHEERILSAHRTPVMLERYVREASERDVGVFIAVAGMSAALPGVIASHTTVPVIGVPVASGSPVMGYDALLSMVQMPPGIPVGTVTINGGRNGALLAARILAVSDASLRGRLQDYRQRLAERVEEKDRRFRAGNGE